MIGDLEGGVIGETGKVGRGPGCWGGCIAGTVEKDPVGAVEAEYAPEWLGITLDDGTDELDAVTAAGTPWLGIEGDSISVADCGSCIFDRMCPS